MEKFVAQLAQITTQMFSWKDEMMETIRLNKPIPPMMNSSPSLSSVNGKTTIDMQERATMFLAEGKARNQ